MIILILIRSKKPRRHVSLDNYPNTQRSHPSTQPFCLILNDEIVLRRQSYDHSTMSPFHWLKKCQIQWGLTESWHASEILVMWAIRFGLLKVPTWDGTQYVTWQMSRLVGPIQLECSTLHGAWTLVTCPRPTIQQNNFQKKEKIINLVNYNLVSSKTLRIQKIWYTNIILIDYKNFSVKKFEVLEI